MSRRDLLSLNLPLATPDSSFNAPEADYWIRVHRQAMACRFEVTLSGEDGGHTEAAREALDEIDRIESALTVFRETSELARVNREAFGAPVVVDDALFSLLRQCQQIHAETGGAFDITSTALSRAWGFLKREGRLPTETEVADALARVGMAAVALDPVRRTVHFGRPGMELNLGSIGKGYALGRIGGQLRARGVEHALLSAAGSSVVAIGGRPGWTVDLRSRLARRERLARLRLRDCALATSGAAEQFVDVAGKRYGHVLDPRTGWPAQGLLSVTVVASDPARADALSTAFLVGGTDLAAAYCNAHPDILALVTPDDGKDEPRVFGAHAGATLEEA